MFQKTLDHVGHPSLTGQVQGREEHAQRGPRSCGTVDIASILHQEAGGGCVVEEDGSVEEGQLNSVTATVPGVGVTPVDHLQGGREGGREREREM